VNQWHFVIAAYGIALISILVLLLSSLVSMRRAEAAADAINRQ